MRRWLASSAALLALAFLAVPPVLLWRARTLREAAEAASYRTGKPIEDSLPAVLAQLAAHSAWARSAHREEARFWMSLAASGERAERQTGPTRRLSRRIARAYSDAIRVDAAFAAPRAVRRLNARSRFDLAGRKRGAALERALARQLGVARALSGTVPGRCSHGFDDAVQRFAPGLLGAVAEEPWGRVREALLLAVRGHDDRALASLANGPQTGVASIARGIVLLRIGKAKGAESALAAGLSRPDAAPLRVVAMTARALARMGEERPHEALLAIGADLGQPAFAAVRLVSSFVTGDTAGARVALGRIPAGSALGGMRRALEPALVDWSEGRRPEGRARIARAVSTRSEEWDFLVPLGRYAAGHLDDLDAWLELSAPEDRLARVWQLYALERAARERHNDARGDELATLRRRMCAP
jgi:hypothetical protein